MPTSNLLDNMAYSVTRTSLYGSTAGTTSVSGTGNSLYFKRDRGWSVQNPPYVKTLPYSDEKLLMRGNAYSYLRQMKPASGIWVDYDFYASPITPTGTSDSEWLGAHVMPSLTEVKNRCISEAGGVTWSLPAFAAEFSKTGQMMFDAAKVITKAYRQARRGNFRAMAKTFGVNNISGVASNWLGYRYGVCTTLLDVQSMAQAAADTLTGTPQVQKVFCRGKTEVVHFEGDTTTLGKPILTTSEKRALVTTVTRSTKAWLLMKVSNQTLLSMNQYGLANPALVVWELVPLSFVADWAIGVGDWLEAQTGLLGLTVLDGGTSQLSVRELSVKTMNKTYGNYRTRMNMAPHVQGISRKYVRSPWDGSAPPIRLSLKMSQNRFIDAAALIRGFLKSH